MRVSRFPRIVSPREEWEDLKAAREYVRKYVKAMDVLAREMFDAVNVNEGSAIASDVLPDAAAAYRGRLYYLDSAWDELHFCSAYGADAGGNLLYRWARIVPPEDNLLVKDDAVSAWENSWADMTSDPYVGFYRDEVTHRCWFMGQANFGGTPPPGTGSGNRMFQLPVGYRPEQDVHFICPDGALAYHEFYIITVDTSGNVYPASVPSNAIGVDLTAVHFRITNMQGA